MAKPKQSPEKWVPKKVKTLEFLNPDLVAFCNTKVSPHCTCKKLYNEDQSAQDQYSGNYVLPGHDFRQFGFIH